MTPHFKALLATAVSIAVLVGLVIVPPLYAALFLVSVLAVLLVVSVYMIARSEFER